MLKDREIKIALKRYQHRKVKTVLLTEAQIKIVQRLLNKHLKSIDEAMDQMNDYTLPSLEFEKAKTKVKEIWFAEKMNTKEMLFKLKEKDNDQNKNRICK